MHNAPSTNDTRICVCVWQRERERERERERGRERDREREREWKSVCGCLCVFVHVFMCACVCLCVHVCEYIFFPSSPLVGCNLLSGEHLNNLLNSTQCMHNICETPLYKPLNPWYADARPIQNICRASGGHQRHKKRRAAAGTAFVCRALYKTGRTNWCFFHYHFVLVS